LLLTSGALQIYCTRHCARYSYSQPRIRFHLPETRSQCTCEGFVRSPNRMEEAHVVPFHLLLPHVYPKGRQAYYSLPRRQWNKPLPHGLLVLSSSKPLTGRTGHYRLRDASVYWNHWRYTLDSGLLPLPDEEIIALLRLTCLVGHHIPLRLLLLLPERRDHLANRHLAGDKLRIASRTPLTPTSVQDKHPSPKYWTPTLTPIDTDPHSLAKYPLNGNLPDDLSNVYAQRPISS